LIALSHLYIVSGLHGGGDEGKRAPREMPHVGASRLWLTCKSVAGERIAFDGHSVCFGGPEWTRVGMMSDDLFCIEWSEVLQRECRDAFRKPPSRRAVQELRVVSSAATAALRRLYV
jgi:hypothetical protein